MAMASPFLRCLMGSQSPELDDDQHDPSAVMRKAGFRPGCSDSESRDVLPNNVFTKQRSVSSAEIGASGLPSGSGSSDAASGSNCSLSKSLCTSASAMTIPPNITNVFELSTSRLISQRRCNILRPMATAYSAIGTTGKPYQASQADAAMATRAISTPETFPGAGQLSPQSSLVLSSGGGMRSSKSCVGFKPKHHLTSASSTALSTLNTAPPSKTGGICISGSTANVWQQPGSRHVSRLMRTESVASSLGAVSTASGSLMAASFNRVQGHMVALEAAKAAPNMPAATGSSTTRSASGRPLEEQQQQQQQVQTPPEDEAAARCFAEAYLKAVTSGDIKWASDPVVANIFADTARLTTADGQKFQGKTAIIRRLNQGMEQFMKMVGQQAGAAAAEEGSAAAEKAAAKMASKLHASFEIKLPSQEQEAPTKKLGGVAVGKKLRHGARAVSFWVAALLGKEGPKGKPTGSGSSSSSKAARAAAGRGPVLVRMKGPRIVVLYSFKYGIRKMLITDSLRIKTGRILSMKRTFKL